MQASSLRRRLPQLIFVIAVSMVGVFLAHGDSTNVHAGSFAYTSSVNLCNQFTGPVAPTDPICSDGAGALPLNTPMDLTNKLAIPTSSYNFSSVVTTGPG